MRLLIQDYVIDCMDVYADYTIDTDDDGRPEVILYDYGLELTGDTVINGLQGREVLTTTSDVSLRGYNGMAWMVDKITAFVKHEERIEDDY